MAENGQLPSDAEASETTPRKRWFRLLVVFLGIILGQSILYGPSLIGTKILLPLDILTLPTVYLPANHAGPELRVQDATLGDLIMQFEPVRRFVAAEYRAGRFPLWLPYQYAGSPLVWPRYSPFLILACATESPRILPWIQLAAALVAGLGAYAYCRRALELGFWPSAIAAWCYPLTGFFIFWQGFPTCGSIHWFPWLILAVHRLIRKPRRSSVGLLSVVTALVLVSGHLDVAGQSLLIAGLYALGCLGRELWQRRDHGAIGKKGALLALGWTLGFALAAPHVWPLLEYSKTSARFQKREAGKMERPPAGISALPQTVLPNFYGSSQTGSMWLVAGNQLESAAASYAGLVAALFVAPLAWFSHRHRWLVIGWAALACFGLAWCLNVPGIVSLLQLPPLTLMSHNRLVFATGFAVVVLTAIGCDALGRRVVTWRPWCWAPLAVVGLLLVWTVYRANVLPEPVATQVSRALAEGKPYPRFGDAKSIEGLQAWFRSYYWQSAFLCGLAALGWLGVRSFRGWRPAAFAALGGVVVGDLLWFALGRNPQCDPALYYPRLPALQQIAKSEPGRVLGYGCLPPSLAQTHGLNDLRGYDSVDPSLLIDLLGRVSDPQSFVLPWAWTQMYIPKIRVENGSDLTLPPILNMLGVRYLVFRGQPPAQIKPQFSAADYWGLVNRAVLPRAFIPLHVQTVSDHAQRLEKLASDAYDPRTVAYVEEPIDLAGPARGEAQILRETPNRVFVSAQMTTPGLLVLGDAWAKGWQVYVNRSQVPVLRVNHYLRGVVVPSGASEVEFRYRPTSVTAGFGLACIAAVFLLIGILAAPRRKRPPAAGPILTHS